MKVYAAVWALSAIAIAVGLLPLGIESPLVVAGLAVVALFAERGRVKLGSSLELSISLLPTLFAAVVFGPLAAMLVGASSLLGEIRSSRYPQPVLRWMIYTSSRGVTGACSGGLAMWVESLVGKGVAGIVAATTAAALLSETLDGGVAATTLKLRGGHAMGLIRDLAPVAAAAVPLYTPVVALLALAYVELSPWTLALFFVPALAAQRTFVLYQQQRTLAEDLAGANIRLERANLSFATALVATLDARDRYTAGHSAAVAIYSRDIAARMDLSDDEQQLAHVAGLVHDIGKIGLPPGLLEKPGALTLEERRAMESHSAIGERILAKVDDYNEIASIVRHHHERVDGNGYPDRIMGDDIPLLARIIAVADAYNAMTSDRPYRDAMPSRVARLRLAQAVGTQFDISVVAAFEAILATNSEDYRLARGSGFSLAAQERQISPLAAVV